MKDFANDFNESEFKYLDEECIGFPAVLYNIPIKIKKKMKKKT